MNRTPKYASVPRADRSAAHAKEGSDASHRVIARNLLQATVLRLEISLAAAVVCHLALKGQDVEHDREIAKVVRWSIVDELSRQIETLGRRARHPPVTNRNRPAVRSKTGPTKSQELRVPRKALDDLCRQLALVVDSATVCHAALETQNAETDREIAATLKHSVIDILEEQIERIRSGGR